MRKGSIGVLLAASVLGVIAVLGTRAYISGHTRPEPAPDPIELTRIAVATKPITFGEALTSDNTALRDWAVDAVPEGAFETLDNVVTETPRYARSALEAGELILPGKLTKPGIKPSLSSTLGEDKRAVTIRVNDVLGVAGLITPGDRVDVLLTRVSARDNVEPSVDVLLQGIPVLAIDQQASAELDTRGDLRTVTLEVDPGMAQKLLLASEIGTLSLALRNRHADDTDAYDSLTLSELLGKTATQEIGSSTSPFRQEGSPDKSRPEKQTSNSREEPAPVEQNGKSAETTEPESAGDNPVEDERKVIVIWHGTERAEYEVAG